MKMAATDGDITLDEISAHRSTRDVGRGHTSHFERYKKAEAILDDNLEYRNFGLDDGETMVYEQDVSEPSRSRRIRGSNHLEEKSEKLRRTGHKIRDRIQDIIDEYDDKIRDCTMRVDGMAMATQWSLGEINVQIALATSRDSRHTRSIAIVTMVFLPGTFFATVFSMGFFNWFGSDGGVVSHYFWIYVLFTAFSTLLTLGSWWYFVSYRNPRSQRVSSEEESSLV